MSLVSSDRCDNQAFGSARSARALQLHLEALAATAAAWSIGYGHELTEVGLTEEEFTAKMAAAKPELRATWAPVADRWLEIVALNVVTRYPTSS